MSGMHWIIMASGHKPTPHPTPHKVPPHEPSATPDLATFSSIIALVSASLLAVVLTLVALIPSLFELARTRISSFLSGEETEERLRNGLRWLSYTIWVFAVATVGGLVGMLESAYFLII